MPEETFSVQLSLSDAFMKSASEHQRDVLAKRTEREIAADLRALDTASKTFVAGSERPKMKLGLRDAEPVYTESGLVLDGQQVMDFWQEPLMAALVRALGVRGRSVLEIGFGLGISANKIQQEHPALHTIVECNRWIFAKLEEWKKRQANADVRTLLGCWQDVEDRLDVYDCILADPYPLDESQFEAKWLNDVTFAAHLFPFASRHLRPGGSFTYFSNEFDSLGREHQRELLKYFSRFEVTVVSGLNVPSDCQYWWTSTMVVVRATK
jgi:guanidinoacetate N-methyltransferase